MLEMQPTENSQAAHFTSAPPGTPENTPHRGTLTCPSTLVSKEGPPSWLAAALTGPFPALG